MTSTLAETPLHSWHVAHGGRMVDFAGWSMPVQYSSIVAEHRACRAAVALFDVSHMGRFSFVGSGGGRLLEALLTRRVAGIRPGQVRYSLITNEAGGILDDVLVYRLPNASDGDELYRLVVNASNRQKIWDWIVAHSGPFDAEVFDVTLHTAMIAVQGPRALRDRGAAGVGRSAIAALLSRRRGPIGRLFRAHQPHRLHGRRRLRAGRDGRCGPGSVAKTDDGCRRPWRDGRRARARDTLRLEAAMPLYGHELDESIDPFQAGLGFAVDLEGRDFPGRDALVKLREATDRPRRIGWQMKAAASAREGYRVLADARQVGRVTSGTLSPTLDRPIAMGYVEPQLAAAGNPFQIDVRGTLVPATSVALPFYRRPKTAKP